MGRAVKIPPRLRTARPRGNSGVGTVLPAPARRAMCTSLRVAEGGRIVIPAEVRERLGLEVGTKLVMTIEGDRATLMSAKAARREVQEWVRRLVPPGVSLSEELMAERKREAERE